MIRSCLSLACLVLFFASSANAQRSPGFTRANTISPYINLFRGNTSGAIGNYFTLVRPLQNQLRFNQMQMAQDRRFQQQLFMNQASPFGVQGQDPNQLPGAQSILRPGVQGIGQPTPAASYFNYSHYYGVPNTGPGLGIRRPR